MFLTNSIGECPSHGLLKKPEREDERVKVRSRRWWKAIEEEERMGRFRGNLRVRARA